MKEWCSPQYLTLEIFSHTGKSWGLKDWNTKYNEICDFLKLSDLATQKKYQNAFVEASRDVAKWESAIEALKDIKIPV